jgi:hypothetical protein
VRIEARPIVDRDVPSRSPAEELRLLERLPQTGYIDLEAMCRGWRRARAPQLVDQPIGRDHLVRAEEQHGEEGALLRTAERHRFAADPDLQRPEQAEPDAPIVVDSFLPFPTKLAPLCAREKCRR